MQKEYIVNKQQRNGKHEVHSLADCNHLPDETNRETLGRFDNCHDAVSKAEDKGYKPANGCYWCSADCN